MAIRQCRCLVIYYESPNDFQNGETAKGHNVINLAKELFSAVDIFSTRGWKRNPIGYFFKLSRQLSNADCVFLVLAINGARFLGSYLIRFFQKKGKKVYYFMVGVGPLRLEASPTLDYQKITFYFQHETEWKPSNSSFSRILPKFDACFVESPTIKKMCEKVYGAKNVAILPNFRMDVDLIPAENDKKFPNKPLRFAYFSRVNKEKGIFDLFDATKKLYSEGFRFFLDIYGSLQIEENLFLQSLDSRFMKYRGVCTSEQIKTLAQYDAQIFPTRSFEGMPGSIVESFFAGTPVISSEFTFSHDFIVDGVNGFIYPFGDADALCVILRRILTNPRLLLEQRKKCHSSASEYLFSNCIQVVGEYFK
jgi:glycosyltransferase involved in cell wall biosynthesis